MLQEGIFHARGTRPPANLGILFLRVAEGVSATAVGDTLAALWQIYEELKKGRIRDLPDTQLPTGDLNVSIGFGPNSFDLPGARRRLPQGLSAEFGFRSAAPGGGNPLLIGSGLSYEVGLAKNPATEDVVVQFLGNTPLSVQRPMVETWKLLHESADPQTGLPRLQMTAFFTGFHREDRRSWIDFHDGVSNPRKGQQRREVVEVKPDDTSSTDAWTRGGSYMTFMRLPVRLPTWVALDRSEQEAIVGRDKVTGCSFDRRVQGSLAPIAGCPVGSTREVVEPGNESFREPPDGVPTEIAQSHVQRANHHRQDFANRESLRIYRQGYEFGETTVNGLPRIGLNFVAFHDSPFRIRELLTRPTWLGGVNFGGSTSDSPTLIDVAAAGIYLLPPVVEGELFPGSGIFLETAEAAPGVAAVIESTRLTFKRDVIQPLAQSDVFEIRTAVGVFRMTKAQFEETFANVGSTISYNENGTYSYPEVPSKAEQYRV